MMPQFDPAFERSELPRPGRPQPRFGGQPLGAGGSVVPVTIYPGESAPTTQMTPTARTAATTSHAHNAYGQDFYGSGERIGGNPVARNAASWMGVQPVSLGRSDEGFDPQHPYDPIYPPPMKKPHGPIGGPVASYSNTGDLSW